MVEFSCPQAKAQDNRSWHGDLRMFSRRRRTAGAAAVELGPGGGQLPQGLSGPDHLRRPSRWQLFVASDEEYIEEGQRVICFDFKGYVDGSDQA